MNVFDNVKKIISRIFYNLSMINSNNSIENESVTNKISIIDTSSLNINRVLTDEEKQRLKNYSQEIDLSNNQIIEYENEISRKVSYYMEISRKRLNQNIEKNQELLKEATARNVISQKLDIEFNNLEIKSIIEELQNLKRECELRIIALEEKGQTEIRKGKRLIFFLENKSDLVKINLINNAIERIKTTIKIIDMLSNSIKNELIATMQEEKSLDRYIENNENEENTRIIKELLNRKFEEEKETLQAILEIGKNEKEFPKSLLNVSLENKDISEKLKIIVKTKRYIDLYVEKNKNDFLKLGGLFEKTKNILESLWQQIETDYFDRELWAKKEFEGFEKYDKVLEKIEKIINIFDEEIPEDFKKKFYRVKFYEKALCNEHNQSDVGKTFLIKNETERNYYLKILSEIIDKIHRTSDDADLLKFMDKNLRIKDIGSILNDYEKITALLRIEKCGRDGLFSLRLFKMNKLANDFKVVLQSKDNPSLYVTAIMNTKSLSNVSLKELSELNGIIDIKYKKIDIDSLFENQLEKYGASSKFALEILNLWSNTPKTTNSIYRFINSKYIEELPKRLVIPELFNEVEFRKLIENEIKNITYSDLFASKSNKNNFKKYNKCTKFHAETEQLINRNIRLEKDKPENERKWKSSRTKIKFINERTGKAEIYNISLAEAICRFAITLENMFDGKVNKIDIRDKILQSDNFNIGQENQSYSYFELMKELTRCLLSGKGKELLEVAKKYLEEYNIYDENKSLEIIDEMSDFVANYINSRINSDSIQEYDYSFLSKSEYSDNENRLEIFKKRGLKSKLTDFAFLLTSYRNLSDDGPYWTRDSDDYGVKFTFGYRLMEVRIINENGERYRCRACESCISARPYITCLGSFYIPANKESIKRAKDGILELEYGYYPQEAASKEMQEKLELAYKDGNLIKTKNTYSVLDEIEKNISKLQEYEYMGKRYVRFDEKFGRYGIFKLNNGVKYNWNNSFWFEVQPVKWWVDEKTKSMITEKLIFNRVPFHSTTYRPNSFKETDIKKFMDNIFSKDLEQSNEVVLLGEQILYSFLTQKEKKTQQNKKDEYERN